MHSVIPASYLERRIYLIRGRKVMLDQDLAALYGVSTGRLNEQVKRNRGRFPNDFMFKLTPGEARSLRSQIAILEKPGRGRHRKYLPLVFSEQGVAMLSSVLNSERAIATNIAIMRAFVRLREMLSTHRRLAAKLTQLERRVGEHGAQIRSIFDAIYELMQPSKIGFRP